MLLNTAMTALMHGRTCRDDRGFRSAVHARVRQRRDERRGPGRHTSCCCRASTTGARRTSPRSRHDVRRRADDVHEAARPPGLRAVRPVVAAHLHGRRSDDAGGDMEETERRFGCPLLELWGMTELGGLGTTHPHNGPNRRLDRSRVAGSRRRGRSRGPDELPPRRDRRAHGARPARHGRLLRQRGGDARPLSQTAGCTRAISPAPTKDGYLFVVDRARKSSSAAATTSIPPRSSA